MFYKYEVRNNGNEDILYLYCSFKYEFSKELNYNDDRELGNISRDFIRTNNIKFNGNKIYLVVDGFIAKKMELDDINNDNYNNHEYYKPDKFLINLKLEDNSLVEITLREYLLSLLLSIHNKYHIEVLKAICVLFNTYSYKCMSENKYIDANNYYYNYVPSINYKSIVNNYEDVTSKLNSIIDSTSCICLTYNNYYILPFIHNVNSGRTKTNIKYPYLSSVKSLWDMTSKNYINSYFYSYNELKNILGIDLNSSSTYTFTDNTNSVLKLGKMFYSVEEIRNKLNLSSNTLYLIIDNRGIEFICIGVGNSLGLSLYGADKIAKNGGKYYNILNYYFPKTKLFRYIKELSK